MAVPSAAPGPGPPAPYPTNNVFFVDFIPSCVSQGGFLSTPEYEPFANLIARANEYLRNNPAYKVLQCESSEKKYNYWAGAIDLDRSTYVEAGNRAIAYIRNLRIWCVVKSNPNDPVQQLSYMNLLPACTDNGGFLSYPSYENFGVTVQKFNEMLKTNPIPGKVLNIESQDITMASVWSDFRVDPERTFFVERGINCYVTCIRVFYISGPSCNEQIGAVDFPPLQTGQRSAGLFGSIPDFEPFVNVMIRANQWTQQQTTINYTNVQALECKYHHWGSQSVNTQEMLFYSNQRNVLYVSFLRVYYTQMPVDSPYANLRPLNLTYRTFEPVQLGSIGFTMGENLPFETQSQTLQRANAWLQQTGAKIISAETIPIRMMSRSLSSGVGSSQHYGSENTLTYESGGRNNWYLFVIRLYFEGGFVEPPPEVLPPEPQVQRYTEQECCAIL